MSTELLKTVIKDGVEGNLNDFFLEASNDYHEIDDDLSVNNGGGFSDFQTLGEITFGPTVFCK